MKLDDLKAMLGAEMEHPAFSVADSIVTATKTCSVTGAQYVVRIPLRNYEQWQAGIKIQDAAPMLTPDQREFLISGTTPAEFEELFGAEEEE